MTFTQKQVNQLLEEKERALEVQYSLLKEVYGAYELLKGSTRNSNKSSRSTKTPMMAIVQTGPG
jgi:hypothetical protein